MDKHQFQSSDSRPRWGRGGQDSRRVDLRGGQQRPPSSRSDRSWDEDSAPRRHDGHDDRVGRLPDRQQRDSGGGRGALPDRQSGGGRDFGDGHDDRVGRLPDRQKRESGGGMGFGDGHDDRVGRLPDRQQREGGGGMGFGDGHDDRVGLLPDRQQREGGGAYGKLYSAEGERRPVDAKNRIPDWNLEPASQSEDR